MSEQGNWRSYLDDAGTYGLRDIVSIEREAARLQSEVGAQMVAALGAGLWRIAKKTGSAILRLLDAIAQGVAMTRLCNELSRLDDGTLADMGIARENIARHAMRMVYGAVPATGAGSSEAAPAVVSNDEVDAGLSLPHRRAA